MNVVAAGSKADQQLMDKQLKQQRLLSDIGVLGEVLQHERVKRLRLHDGPTYAGGVLKRQPPDDSALNIFDVSEPIADSSILANEAEWQDVEFEVALDSGSQDHVCDEIDCPGYSTVASPGSSRGQCFIAGSGDELPNVGQRQFNMRPLEDGTIDVKSCFQIARVTRPLMSVGKLCDNGLEVTFNDKQAIVRDKDGAQICCFERAPGGLYLCKFRLKRPDLGFPRQG